MINYFKEIKELKYLAYHDSLTGLLNRNWLYKNINKINKNYVYFIDINDLKVVNKEGHTVGDKHIKNIVNLISVEKGDILIRYAGDEFILFSNTKNLIKTNLWFSVGMCLISDNIMTDIDTADENMIKNKKNWKLKNLNKK